MPGQWVSGAHRATASRLPNCTLPGVWSPRSQFDLGSGFFMPVKRATTNPTLTLPRLGREPIRFVRLPLAAIRLLPQSGGGWEGVGLVIT